MTDCRASLPRAALALFLVAWPAAAAPRASAQAPAAAAQPPGATAALPVFEVSSVKPADAAGTRMGIRFTPDGITISGIPLHVLVREAFGVSNDRLLGEPGWVISSRFDIQAKVDPADAPSLEHFTFQQRWAMILPLLEERFGLKFHHETKNMTVYALVIARGGPKMKEAVPGDTYPHGLKPPDSNSDAGMMSMGRGVMTVQAVPMSSVVRLLSMLLSSTVVDQTGLTGKYDFTMRWAPDLGEGSMLGTPIVGPSPGGAPPDGAAAPDPTGPSIFTALQEQLGLKLEARKAPVDVVVIDHIQQPSPN